MYPRCANPWNSRFSHVSVIKMDFCNKYFNFKDLQKTNECAKMSKNFHQELHI